MAFSLTSIGAIVGASAGVAALLWNMGSFFYSKKKEKSQKTIQQFKDILNSKIVIPHIIEPLIAQWNETQKNLHDLSTANISHRTMQFQTVMTDIKRVMLVFSPIDETLTRQALNLADQIEDNIAECFSLIAEDLNKSNEIGYNTKTKLEIEMLSAITKISAVCTLILEQIDISRLQKICSIDLKLLNFRN